MKYSKYRKWLGLATMSASLAMLPTAVFAEERDFEEMEEIIVTGSFIKRTTASSASPLSVVDLQDIEDTGINTIAELVANLSFNTGSTSRPNAFADGSNGGGNINLRGLGLGSTLVLLNGKRQTTVGGADPFVNTETLLPRIAIKRLEIIKDGAAALYGSDAIAGVANFIARDDFEGIDVDLFFSQATEGGTQEDSEISAIFGVGNDTSHIMASFSYLDRSPLRADERSFTRRTGPSGSGNPGTFLPTNLLGVFDGARFGSFAASGGLGDLDCDQFVGNGSFPGEGAVGGCGFDFSAFFPLVQEQERILFYSSISHAFSENHEFYGEFSIANNSGERNNSTFPFTNATVLPANHLGLINDSARRGLIDISLAGDVDGDGDNDIVDASLAIQNDPTGGVGPFDPTTFGPLRFIGRIRGGQPGNQPGDVDTDTRFQNDNTHIVAGFRGDLPGRWFSDNSWTYDVAYNYSQFQNVTRNRDTLLQGIKFAFAGFGGAGCDPLTGVAGSGNTGTGDCFFFNPFGSSQVTSTGEVQTDPLLTNSDELFNNVIGQIRTRGETELITVDAMATGDIFTFNGNPVGLAVGLQYRYDTDLLEVDSNSANFNFAFTSGANDFDIDRDVVAAFVELQLPILDSLEAQVAVRVEDYGRASSGSESTDPKLALIWTPTDAIAVRASAGTSFKVPSLVTLAGTVTQLQNTTDGPSGTSLFVPIISSGNPDLAPSETDVYNLGFSFTPVDGWWEGFGFDIDFYKIDFEDLVIREGFQDLIDAEVASRTDPNDPFSCTACNPKVVRNIDGSLREVRPEFINADEIDASGVDFTIGYHWDTNRFGSFGAKLAGTYLIEYDIKRTAVDPVSGLLTNVTDSAVGKRNNGRSAARSLPRIRSNLALNWNKGRQRVAAFVRYTHDYDNSGGGDPITAASIGETANGTSCGSTNPASGAIIADGKGCKIDSWTSFDINYSYELPAIAGLSEGVTLTLGAINLFDEEPPAVNTIGGIDTVIHDSRGRIIYGKVSLAL